MAGPEYRVLLRGLKDNSESARAEFLKRFGEAYKMSPDQAAQWLKNKKGVVYTVKTAEAADKARRYLEGLGAVAAVEKTGGEPEPERAEPPRLILDEPAPAPATPQPAAPAPATSPDDAFVSVTAEATAPAAAPAPTASEAAPAPAPTAPAAPLRACPHCTFPYRSDQPVCPACKRPAVYTAGPTSAAAMAYGPAGSRPDTSGYDLSAIINMTIETYKNNFGTLYGLSLLPMLLGMGVGAGIAGAVAAGMVAGKEMALPLIAAAVGVAVVALPLFLYAMFYVTAALMAAVDVAIRGDRVDFMGILKAVPPMMPVQLMANGLLVGLIVCGAIAPFTAVLILAAVKKMVGLAVLAALPIFPIAAAAGILFMFVMPATVLEGRWTMEAIRRSIDLGKGYYLRNFAILFLLSMAVAVAVSIVSMPFQLIPLIGPLLSPFIQALGTPLTTIPIVLLFYDMRLKKQM